MGLEAGRGNLYDGGVKTRRSIVRVAALAVLLSSAGVASGQSVRPPNPSSTDKPPLTTYLMVVVVAVLVIGGNLIPSKRGHQD